MATAVLAAILYAALLFLADLRDLGSHARAFPWWRLGAALGLVMIGYALRVLRWHILLAALGHPARPATSALSFLSGFAMGVTPGKVGELVKAYFLAARQGTPYPVTVAAVVADRALDLVAVTAVLATSIAFVPGLGAWGAALLLAAVVAALLVLRSRRAAAPILLVLARTPILRRAAPPAAALHDRLRPLLSARPGAYGLLLGLAAWGLEPFAMWLLAPSFGLHLSMAQCGVVFAAASLGGVATMIPGGLGATEGGMVALLRLFHAPLAGATALTLATRLATLWFGVLVGAVSILLWRRGAAHDPHAAATVARRIPGPPRPETAK